MSHFTNRLSRILQMDVEYLRKNGSWLWLGQSITIITGFAASVLYANLLDPTDLGTYQFIITMAGFFSIFSLTGMGTSMVRTVAQGTTGLLDQAVSTYLRWSFLTIIIALGVSGYFYWNGNEALAAGMICAAVCVPLWRAFSLYVPYLHGQKKFRQSVWLGCIGTIVPTTAVVTGIFVTHNPLYLAIVSLLSSTTITYLLYQYTKWHDTAARAIDVSEMISYSKHLSIMNVLGQSVSYVERIVLFAFTNPATLAAYHFASLAPKQFNDVDRVLKKLLLPKLSQRDFATIKHTLPRKVFWYFLLMLVIVLIYILVAPLFFAVVFPQYEAYVFHSQIFALSALFQPISVLSRALTAHMKKRALYIQSILVPSLALIILFVLVPMYGLWGAIFSTLARGFVHNIIVTYFFIRTN